MPAKLSAMAVMVPSLFLEESGKERVVFKTLVPRTV